MPAQPSPTPSSEALDGPSSLAVCSPGAALAAFAVPELPPLPPTTLPPGTALFAISQLLNTGLDRQALAHCIALVEGGVDPEALAVRSACFRLCRRVGSGRVGELTRRLLCDAQTAVQELRDEQRRLASSSSAGR